MYYNQDYQQHVVLLYLLNTTNISVVFVDAQVNPNPFEFEDRIPTLRMVTLCLNIVQ